MRTIYDRRFRFASSFDPETGVYVRTNIYDAMGRDTRRDAFMASFPHLLDVGIMGHCRHGLSGQCAQSGVQCYQNGPNRFQPNMPLDDFKCLADECSGRVYQFALGGRGDPDMHEDFEAILAYSRDRGIVPNLTTSGWGLTRAKARLMKQYCGAAAVSWYDLEHTLPAIELLLAEGVQTNIHYVLSNRSLAAAIRFLEAGEAPAGIHKVIFLLHKPVGLGQSRNVLRIFDSRVRHFFNLFNREDIRCRGGFDSCSVPALLNLAPGVHGASLETCEGARFSAYVTPDLRLLPCSFDQAQRWAVELRGSSIEQAWYSEAFEDFRHRLRTTCPGCQLQELCLGGCPIAREIVLCGNVQEGMG